MFRVLIKRMVRFSSNSGSSDPNKLTWSKFKYRATGKNEPKQLALESYPASQIQETKLCDIPPTKDLLPIENYAKEYAGNSIAIIKPMTKIVTQQGTSYLGSWEITFDTKQRWEHPEMGWCSSGDALSNLSLTFPNKESAVEFVIKRGWNYYVDEIEEVKKEKKVKKFKPKSYSENFSYNRRTRISTK